MKIPTIETERLILRPLTFVDAADVFEWAGEKYGLYFDRYREFKKLDGSCKAKSKCYIGKL